jgi:hypothetical protein
MLNPIDLLVGLVEIVVNSIHSFLPLLPRPWVYWSVWLLFALGSGFRVRLRRGKTGFPAIVFFFPVFVYELVPYALYVFNWAISISCYFQRSRGAFDETKSKHLTKAQVEKLRRRILKDPEYYSYDEQDILALFDVLPAADTKEHLLGNTFDGKILRTGGSVLDLPAALLNPPLRLMGFGWGKRYVTHHVGDPLLLNWLQTIYCPIPAWGNVGCLNMTWRGKCTATMNYDMQYWKDYFVILEDSGEELVLLGSWTSREQTGGWFTLTLDQSQSGMQETKTLLQHFTALRPF